MQKDERVRNTLKTLLSRTEQVKRSHLEKNCDARVFSLSSSRHSSQRNQIEGKGHTKLAPERERWRERSEREKSEKKMTLLCVSRNVKM